MAESIKGLKRTHYCGELRLSDSGKEVTLFGWCQKQRDLGNLIFIDLRDRTGIVQLSFNDTTDREVFEKAQSVRAEFVVAAVGTVCERESKNKELPTGDIEISVKEFRIIAKSETPPFEIANSEKVGDETTLKYRYLNLRNQKLTQNIIMRHKIAKIAREYFYDNDFIEIETPMMIKSTPEGARDYVVPSRVHNGKFYALPQSPQIYKQLCMVAGFDRYIQLARCFRDEDLRADRQPEFTQIDLEMSFVDTDDIMEMAEGFITKLMKETVGVDIPMPLPRMTFAQAMEKYGTDKPDTRFEMLINDITEWADKTDFGVFKNAIADGGSVRAIVAENSASVYTRKKIDKLTEHARGIGAKGLAYIRWADEEPNCSFAKFLKETQLQELIAQLGAKKGDCIFIVSDKTPLALSILGAIRLIIAKELDIIGDRNKGGGIVFEFGSRYGEDSVGFAKFLQDRGIDAHIYSFECNDKTLPQCLEAVAPYPNITLTQKAISQTDGFITFYSINAHETKTTHSDGNQGASSMFKASGKYPIEQYVQDEVRVPSTRLDSFMREHNVSHIDILWMDIQGGELEALKSLGDRLQDVNLIYTEVEFMEIYEGQPLFEDIKGFLEERGFMFVGVSDRNDYFANALIIHTRFYRTPLPKGCERFVRI